MRRPELAWIVVAGVIGAGCTSNDSPGNDREAALDAPRPPAELASVPVAIGGVATGLLQPQVMSAADLENLPGAGKRCTFRMTEVGFPVFVYGTSGVLKLNDRLISLPTVGDGRYAADGLDVTIRPLSDGGGDGVGRFAAEFVVWLPGAPNELGFHGFSTCT